MVAMPTSEAVHDIKTGDTFYAVGAEKERTLAAQMTAHPIDHEFIVSMFHFIIAILIIVIDN